MALICRTIVNDASTLILSSNKLTQGIFYGWWVLGSCMVLQVLTSTFTVQAFGAFVAVMAEEFSWSKTSFSIAFAIQQAGGGFIGPLVGWFIQKFGTRLVIRVGLTIFAFALMSLSLVQNLFSFFIVVFVMAFGASNAGFLPLNNLTVQWFERRRSTALALMQVGVSVGGLLVPLIAWALVAYGWRATAVASGMLVLIIGIPLTFVIGNSPEDYGLEPDGVSKQEKAQQPVPASFTAKEALRTRAFWAISIGHSLALMVVFSVLVHLIVYLNEGLGFSLQLAATIVAVMTTFTITGQLLGGFLGDKFNKQAMAFCAMFGHATAMLCLAFGNTIFWVLAFAVINGLSWGVRGPIMQAMRADYFGRKAYAQIMGYSSVIVTVGIVIGPVLAGVMADTFGNYRAGFTVLAACAAIGSICFIFASPPKPKTV